MIAIGADHLDQGTELPNLPEVAAYIRDNAAFPWTQPHSLIFLCCGSCKNEIRLSRELRSLGLNVCAEIYFDKFITDDAIRALCAHQKAIGSEEGSSSRVICLTSLLKLKEQLQVSSSYCGHKLLIIAINGSFGFSSKQEVYDFHSFCCECERLSQLQICQPYFMNFLGGRSIGGEYGKQLPCIHNEETRVYRTTWWSYGNEKLQQYKLLLCKSSDCGSVQATELTTGPINEILVAVDNYRTHFMLDSLYPLQIVSKVSHWFQNALFCINIRSTALVVYGRLLKRVFRRS